MSESTTQAPDKPPTNGGEGPQAVKLYNANDGLTGRDGGPYLDIELAKAAEIRRAEIEGREPDFDTMPGGPGIKYVTAEGLVSVQGVSNTPSQFDNPSVAQANAAAIDSLENVHAAAEVPAEAVEVPEQSADLSTVAWLAGEYNPEGEEETTEEEVTEETPAEEEYDPLAEEPQNP